MINELYLSGIVIVAVVLTEDYWLLLQLILILLIIFSDKRLLMWKAVGSVQSGNDKSIRSNLSRN